MSACNICACSFNKTIRQSVECPKCGQVACRQCCSRYIMDNCADSPVCIFPQHCPWSEDFVCANFPASFVKHMFEKQRDILVEQAKLRIPSIMNHVETYKQCCNIDKQMDETAQRMRDMHCQLIELRSQYNMLDTNKSQMMSSILGNTDSGGSLGKYTTVALRCPSITCNGYLNQSTMKCTLCDVFVCKKCSMQILDDTHICKPDDIETTKYVHANSKPCPKCSTRISKVDGCDQMWCVNPSCQTAFSWRTGAMVNGIVHNPEYYRFMRENDRLLIREEERTEQCGRGNRAQKWGHMLTNLKQWRRVHDPSRASGTHPPSDEQLSKYAAVHECECSVRTILRIYECAMRIEQYLNMSLSLRIQQLRNTNTTMDMVKYVLNEIDDNKFRATVTKHHVKIKRAQEYQNTLYSFQLVLDEALLYLSGIDFLSEHMNPSTRETVQTVLDRCDHARILANNDFERIGKKYKVMQIDIDSKYCSDRVIGISI